MLKYSEVSKGLGHWYDGQIVTGSEKFWVEETSGGHEVQSSMQSKAVGNNGLSAITSS